MKHSKMTGTLHLPKKMDGMSPQSKMGCPHMTSKMAKKTMNKNMSRAKK